MTENSLRKEIFSSVAGALLGSVTPYLRAVAADWDDVGIHIVCYFHGPISEDDQEIMSIVHTEVAADFIDTMPVDLVTERLDMPARMNYLRVLCFERKESKRRK